MRFPEVDKRWEHSGNLCWLTTVQLARSTIYFFIQSKRERCFSYKHVLEYLRFHYFYVIVSGCWEKTLWTKLTFFPNTRGHIWMYPLFETYVLLWRSEGNKYVREKIVTIWIQNKIWEKILWKSHHQCQFNILNVNIAKGTEDPRHWVLWPTQQLKFKAEASTRFEIFSLVWFGKGQEINTFYVTT